VIQVIIPSKNAVNLARCVDAVHANEMEFKIVVVDDGVDWDQYESPRRQSRLKIEKIKGPEPFIFSRNVNLGIESLSRKHPICVMNDDALLDTAGGLTLLSMALSGDQTLAAIGATTNAGHSCQRRSLVAGEYPRIVRHFAFVCVVFSRRGLDEVGMLDERFTAYGYDDNDWNLRAKMAGLRVAVHDGCYVDHLSLRSQYRGNPYQPANLEPGKTIFREKWKDLPDLESWI
jgi:GT2 family glycosyltransferase